MFNIKIKLTVSDSVEYFKHSLKKIILTKQKKVMIEKIHPDKKSYKKK